MRTKESCGPARRGLLEALIDRLGVSLALRRHMESCPRCQRRASRAARLSLALVMLRTQAHGGDLLLRANRKAIAMLKRNVRDLPQAERLRTVLPRPKLHQRLLASGQSVLNAAACVIVLLLLRAGVISSMTKVHDEGKQVLHQYYASQLGEEMADEIT